MRTHPRRKEAGGCREGRCGFCLQARPQWPPPSYESLPPPESGSHPPRVESKPPLGQATPMPAHSLDSSQTRCPPRVPLGVQGPEQGPGGRGWGPCVRRPNRSEIRKPVCPPTPTNLWRPGRQLPCQNSGAPGAPSTRSLPATTTRFRAHAGHPRQEHTGPHPRGVGRECLEQAWASGRRS